MIMTVGEKNKLIVLETCMAAFRAMALPETGSLQTSCAFLIEHWDVIQDEATEAESKSGSPMFGAEFALSNSRSPAREA